MLSVCDVEMIHGDATTNEVSQLVLATAVGVPCCVPVELVSGIVTTQNMLKQDSFVVLLLGRN